MLISINLHKKSSEVSTKTRSPPASFKGQATTFTTVKWSARDANILSTFPRHTLRGKMKKKKKDFDKSDSTKQLFYSLPLIF